MLRAPQRRVLIDTGPRGANPFSSSFIKFFYTRVTSERSLIPFLGGEVPEWDSLEVSDASLWNKLSALPFMEKKEWSEETVEMEYVPNSLKWGQYLDPVPGCRLRSEEDRDRLVKKAYADFEDINRYNDHVGVEDLILRITSALLKKQVVLVSAPPGYGKSVLAHSIAMALDLKEREGGQPPGPGPMTRGELDRPASDLTKSIQCVPTATNASSIAHYLYKTTSGSSVCGLLSAMHDVDNVVDGDLQGVEHLILPYRSAERLIDEGRFKLIILDEIHLDDCAIKNVFYKSLSALQPPFTSGLSAPRSKRADKLLLLSGIRSDDLESEIESAISKQNLSYEILRIPNTNEAWENRRFDVTHSYLQCSSTGHQNPLSKKISAMALREGLFSNDLQLALEERDMIHGSVDKFPEFMVKRIVLCTRALISHFAAEAEEHRKKCEKHMGAPRTPTNPNMNPHKIPTILVLTPSTACSRQVFKELRFCMENLIRPYPTCNETIQPYRFDINVSVDDEERSLSEPLRAPCQYKSELDDGALTTDSRFVKGQVLIVMNGVEAGLTIDEVGAVVDSGMERLRGVYHRSGISQYSFCLTDQETLNQRGGRAGRTRPGHFVVALGKEGLNYVWNRQSSVIMEKRRTAMRQQDFLRMVETPALRAHSALRPFNWMEAVVEARVKGTVHESNNGLSGMRMFEDSKVDLKFFPNVDPIHVRELRALSATGMKIHGAVRCALLNTGELALKKPSSGNQQSAIGISLEMNALDVFKWGVTSCLHKLVINGGGGREEEVMRVLKQYESDTLALVDLHVQLILASGWKIDERIPSKQELLAAVPDDYNFWSGKWMRKQWFKEDRSLRTRLTTRQNGEEDDFLFLYGRLIEDEERRRLWGALKMIVLGMKMSGMISHVEDVMLGNSRVLNEDTSPLLTYGGRALFSIIDVMHSSRFAKACSSYETYKRGQDKPRGKFTEWYNSNELVYKFPVPQGETFHVSYKERCVRAESSWKIRDDHAWLRFDCTETMRRFNNEEVHITLCDGITDAQMVVFANVAGRWRIVLETTAEENGSTIERYLLEIEGNARTSLFGFSLEMNKEQAEMLKSAREWLARFVPLFINGHGHDDDQYKQILEQLITLWYEIGPTLSQVEGRARHYPYFED